MPREVPYLLASDVGGTFTDLVLLDGRSGQVRVEKVPTTPHDPAEAVLAGTDALTRAAPGTVDAIGRVIHATTLIANTLVERTGARTALLVTEGFRDLLRLRRHTRVGTFDLYADPPEPLVPRQLTFPVPERLLADGKVHVPLDEAAVATIADRLVELDVEAVAVVLLHSYLDPTHEERVDRIIAERAPGIRVTLSSRLLRRHMEYERANTTVASAYCAGRLGRYLERLSDGLHDRRIDAPIAVMSSSGGFLSAKTAVAAPVRLVESGPSAGATYTAELARRLDLGPLLAFDMGGTTAKACLITGGRLPMSTQVEAARADSYRPGSGIPLQVAAVNLIEVGSGGGSVAFVDTVGLLRVGPRSAAAVPGPACYLRGGTEPTVTDADVVLGHLTADGFLGGRMRLGEDEARVALRDLRPDGDEVEAARLVQEVVVENMAGALLRHIIERGGDPRHLTMVAFGGAGPVHAYALARRLGMRQVIVPPLAGVLSAVGLLTAQPSFQASRTIKADLSALSAGELFGPLDDLRAEVAAALQTADASAEPHYRMSADCSYAGQSTTLSILLDDPDATDGHLLRTAFEAAYRTTYGHVHTGVAIELAALTVEGTLDIAHPELPRDNRSPVTVPDSRPAWSHVTGRFEQFTVRWRTSLQPGETIDGPVIIAETESATIVDVDGSVRVDDLGNLLVEVGR